MIRSHKICWDRSESRNTDQLFISDVNLSSKILQGFIKISDLYFVIKISADTKTYHDHVLRMHKQIMKQRHQLELVGVMYEPNPFASHVCNFLHIICQNYYKKNPPSLHCKCEIITILLPVVGWITLKKYNTISHLQCR